MSYQLAELNVARLRAPIDSPELQDFVANLDRINALAESSEGFVWRLKDEGNDATSMRPMGEDVIVNMSVWRDADSLKNYVYRSGHVEVMRRRKEWFERMVEAYLVMWWIPKGRYPTVEEAIHKLELLRVKGPTPEAFNFRTFFPAPDVPQADPFISFGDTCPA